MANTDGYEEAWYNEDYEEGLDDVAQNLNPYISPTGRIRRRNPPIQSLNPYINIAVSERGHYDLKALAPDYATIEDHIINQKGNTTMDLHEKTEMLQRQMNVLLEQLAVLNRFPKEDPCIDGNIIAFARKFPGNEQLWYYAAIRIEGKYYLTGGKSNPQGCTWSGLIGWMGPHVDSITLMGPGRELMHVPTAAEPMTDEEYAKKTDEYRSRPRAVYDNPQA